MEIQFSGICYSISNSQSVACIQ